MSLIFDWSVFDHMSISLSFISSIINKARRLPMMVGDIEVEHVDLGSASPDLQILEINKVDDSCFSGIIQLKYSGNASLTIRSLIEINHLHLFASACPRWALPGPILGASALQLPLRISISQLNIATKLFVSYTKEKGATVVVLDENPLQSVLVTSTLDSIEPIKHVICTEITQRLQESIIEDIPPEIFKMSIQSLSELSVNPESGPVDNLYSELTIFQSAWFFLRHALGLASPAALRHSHLESKRATLALGGLFENHISRGMLADMDAPEPEVDIISPKWPGLSNKTTSRNTSELHHTKYSKTAKTGPRRIIKLDTVKQELKTKPEKTAPIVHHQPLCQESCPPKYKISSSFSLLDTPYSSPVVAPANLGAGFDMSTHEAVTPPSSPPQGPTNVFPLSPRPHRAAQFEQLQILAQTHGIQKDESRYEYSRHFAL